MPEVAGDCPKISLGEFFLDASVPNGPNYNTPELIGDLKKLTGPTGHLTFHPTNLTTTFKL